jgi:polyferredoxin
MKRKITGIQLARRISLGFFLTFATVMTFLHQKLQNIPNIDSFCPFGGLETLFKFVAGGDLLKKLEISNIFLLVSIVILAIALSRFFCGWICAFGALQGIFGSLGKKLFGKRFTVPRKLDAVLRYFKYVVLFVILAWTWTVGELVIRPYDPWAAYGHLSAGIAEIWGEFAVGLVILVLSLVLSMLYERAFCKYVCPLGAFNAILGKIPLFRIKREASTCISCSVCNKACPMNIDVMNADEVKSAECISCMECVTSCPTKKGTLKTFLAGKAIPLAAVAALGLGLYFGPIAVGHLTNTIRFKAATLNELAQKGSLAVEDIKGSSTWAQVAESFGIELERLYRETGVDAKKVPADAKLKDTGGLMGIEFEADAVRFAVAKIIGVPYAGEKGDAAPVPAIEASQPAAGTTAAAPAATAPAAAAPAPAERVLEGTMTVAEVAGANGMTPEEVLKKLGLPADTPLDKPLRDMKDDYGYRMPDLKDRFAK